MAELKVFSYAFPCTTRAVNYFQNKLREGLFVRVDTGVGVFGIGEYAPLSGIHTANINDVIFSLKSFSGEALQQVLASLETVPFYELDQFFARLPQFLSYALSMVHFHRSALKKSPTFSFIKLAALIETGDLHAACALAQSYVAQGFSHLKIKVGRHAVHEEINKIKTISALVGPNINLRLDANRSFSFDRASKFLAALKRVNIEYFEEPTYEIHRLHELWARHQINLAVDESLIDVNHLSWCLQSKINYVIIKPARFNNLYTTFKLVRDLKDLGIAPIFSHCFESEFSSAIFALMIDALHLYENAHGILVDGIFRESIFPKPLRNLRGQLSLADASYLIANFRC